MRRNIVSLGADQLSYEIRGIVGFAKKIERFGQKISWENVGDPVNKGEKIPTWIKNIIKDIVDDDLSWGYSPTKGIDKTREFLALIANREGNNRLNREDIVFFNGLGDAISKVYSLLNSNARVIGPSPAYPTHSSAEGAHSNYEQITYKLDPKNNWIPDIEDLRFKVKYNNGIAGILIINPDNPTGMVYPRKVLEEIIAIAREYDLFLISDEIYCKLVYNGGEMVSLSELINGDIPTIIMKGISKEFPWPGGRCGWIEVYNKDRDENFARFFKSIVDSKMLEVCSTTLPQMAIPKIFTNPKYQNYIEERNKVFERRSNLVYNLLKDVPGIIVNKTQGAFYTSIVFEKDVLNVNQKLKIENPNIETYVKSQLEGLSLDKRFVYYLLGSCGICVVPLSSFCSDLQGFRITLLEEDWNKFQWIFKTLKEKIEEYLSS
ncbi:MAG: pyridoxal phosphate-dependent aminotransferase [Nanoarchaeota archaeon]|nr:pyridoxal phosphate-dependent aminotransferase [Nanoarchaeota archaeon]